MELIRPFEKKDIDALLLLCAEHAAYEQADFSPSGKAEALCAHFLADTPSAYCWVLEENQKLVGYLSCSKEFSTWDADFYLHMDCLFLLPEARNRGLGEKLVRLLVSFAKSQNIKQLQWQTPTFNEGAIRFYKRIGAKEKSKQRFTLQQDAMELLIN